MSAYQVVFETRAATELNGLPKRPGVALYETLTAVSRDPWALTTEDPLKDDAAFRYVRFDHDDGIVHLRIDDEARTVYVQNLVWLG